MKLSFAETKLRSELKRTNERIHELWKKGKQYGMEIYNKYVERLATAENIEKGLVHFTKDGRLRVTQSPITVEKEFEFLKGVRNVPTLTQIKKEKEKEAGEKMSLEDALQEDIDEYIISTDFVLQYEKAKEHLDDSELMTAVPELYKDGRKSYQDLKLATIKLKEELTKRGVSSGGSSKRMPFTQV